MKVKINGKALNDVLKRVKPFVDTKNKYTPILKTVKIAASDAVYITATDLMNTIIAEVPGGQVVEKGELCVDYKELQQMVKGQTEPITITSEVIEADGIIITYQPMDAEDYPEIKRITSEEQQYSTNLSNDFIKGVSVCAAHIDRRANRPAFKGVWIDGKNIFGSDTFTMAVYAQEEIQYSREILIMGDSANCIVNVFKKADNVRCVINGDLIELLDDKNTVICRLSADTDIPNYNGIIKGLKSENYITVDSKYFKSIIAKLPKSKKSTKVDLKISVGIVEMRTDIVAPFEITCKDVCSDGLDMRYDNAYMQRLVNSFDLKEDKELTIKLNEDIFTIQNDKLLVIGMAAYRGI